MSSYGRFTGKPGCYTITKLPRVGSYEYIFKNDSLLVKVDQHGIIMAQINPPVGEALVKREPRERTSPIKVYFDGGEGVYNTFDGYRADEVNIEYSPERAVYTMRFGSIESKCEIFIASAGERFALRTTLTNKSDTQRTVRIMPTAFPYVNALLMAPWDKPEWYTRTEYKKGERDLFKTTRFSVSGKREERRFFTCVCDTAFDSYELSAERLVGATDAFSSIPESFSGKTEPIIYAFEQCFAGVRSVTLDKGESTTLTLVFACTSDEERVAESISASEALFSEENVEHELDRISAKYARIFEKRRIKTGDVSFDSFVNGFLPLELDWVSALDRGWPTGMRGVRDAANDFQGFLAYDKALCRSVIANVFSKQRSDGWYPRQVPFGDSDKFDMRAFVDSACFFTEYVYDYLAFTDDYTILTETYPYHDTEVCESGLAHLVRGIEYLMAEENIGEHGLVKIRGGDWLDSLGGAGLRGRGETVMVSCQLVMCISYLIEIYNKLGVECDERYSSFRADIIEAINRHSWCEEGGFYRGVFSDDGKWIFSESDPDGEKRVYVPTNSYAIISGVAEGKEKRVLDNVKELRTENGYKLFTTPFGVKRMDGIGKMGTGDFQAYFAENGSVYNHGSQCFLLRALAEVGESESFSEVLNFALPHDEISHDPDATCSAPYAITNCYHLVPSFYGRSGFSFLTGSVAMIERAVYSWMYGVRFTLGEVKISPCLPERYKNSSVTIGYADSTLEIEYRGSGSIRSATVDGVARELSGGAIVIEKDYFKDKKTVKILCDLA